jgi:acyl-CoA synthetase (AMP-forming)/AMP-acid ligase II
MNANIAGWLHEMAQAHAKMPAIIEPRSIAKPVARTFEYVSGECDFVNAKLVGKGVTVGSRVALMVPPGEQFVEYTFSLFGIGAVPVLIDPGMRLRGIDKCMEKAAPEYFVGSRKAHIARLLFGWGRKSIRKNMLAHQVPTFLYYSPLQICENRASSDLAAILFTSGSTGPAKGAVYTHGMFQEQVRVLREVFGIESGEVDLCTFPLFALFAPALGMTSVVPDMDPTRPAKADPKKIIKAIVNYKVTNLFGSPALIDVLSRYGEQHNIKLPSLRRVISAGAPVSAKVVARMTKMLNPGVQVFTPYGATEALPIAVIGGDEILGETRYKTEQGAGICVGRPVGRIEIRIDSFSPRPMAEGGTNRGHNPNLAAVEPEYSEAVGPPPPATGRGLNESRVANVGEICVRGPVVSPRYWNNPEADASHKICDGDTVWHRTGDVGYFDEFGRLWFCGRKAHCVVVDKVTMFTIPVEAVFNTVPGVYRTALVGAKNRAAICVELEKRCSRSLAAIRRDLEAVRDRFPHTAKVSEFLFHRGFPVDIRHNAKINREKLAIWAARRLR